jgi:threonine dehydrogenase-like Zn-dependent dehydrogenase
MRAVTWQGKRNVSVDTVDDPSIQTPTDAIVRITSSGICGSDLHLYEVLGPYMSPGDILGHEPMGIVEAVGSDVEHISVGDRVVVPFQIACGHCYMCNDGLQTQCETTQVTSQGMGAALFGYTQLYGQVPGAQAELLRVPHADYGPIRVPHGPSDDRFVYLSDVLPTAWQAVEYADIPKGGSVAILGLGPIGEMAARVARIQGAETIIGVDLVEERLERARRSGVTTLDLNNVDDVAAACRTLTNGRGPDSVIDAVGMEAHGSPGGEIAHKVASALPDALGQKVMERGGIDRLNAVHTAIQVVKRGGTISLIGVYGGAADPLPMLTMFDKQIKLRMGQANVRHWSDDILPLLLDDRDPLGVDDFATHRVSLEQAPEAYEQFQAKSNGTFKVLLQP